MNYDNLEEVNKICKQIKKNKELLVKLTEVDLIELTTGMEFVESIEVEKDSEDRFKNAGETLLNTMILILEREQEELNERLSKL